VLCFGAERESRLRYLQCQAPRVAEPGECGPFFEDRQGRNQGPNFAQHFDSRRAGGALPMTSDDTPEFTVWMRHRDRAIDPLIVSLVALADALPSAAMACFDKPTPVSSMTWMFDLLTPEPSTRGGWWLCHSRAESIAAGCVSFA
jgi:hypothetical protein